MVRPLYTGPVVGRGTGCPVKTPMGLGRQQEFRSGEDGRWNQVPEAKLLSCSKAGWATGKNQGLLETA